MCITSKDHALNYMVGFLQTDGSFSLEFKKDSTMSMKYRLLPVITFYQKEENLFLLEEIESRLNTLNVRGKI